MTAVDYLVKELNKKMDYIPLSYWPIIRDIVQQAKAIERQQIINAYGQGVADEVGEVVDATQDAEQYYKDKYK